MFRTLQNLANIQITLRPDGPLLVRAQSVGIDPGPADMEFQRTHRDGKPTVFLAGSGLKGVLRSHCERLLRSANRFACDPTQIRDSQTCGATRKKTDPPRDPARYPHAENCAACFTFGSLKMAGRFHIADAYPAKGEEDATNRTEVRTGVGIDRKSQAASGSVLYDAEVVVGGAFDLRIAGENYSLWQLGLILAALQDLDTGLLRIGGAKARGMGAVHLDSWSVELSFLNAESGKLTGIQALDQGDRKYRLPCNDLLAAPSGHHETSRGLFRLIQCQGDSVQALATSLTEGPLKTYLRSGSR
ncbi:MAG: RAMP superfamily CRISPR-associated protein [Acidobacteriota bacterium]|nr:RAMP superfamily CRISPR-associated protein [Acidobacteriota bacterium]